MVYLKFNDVVLMTALAVAVFVSHVPAQLPRQDGGGADRPIRVYEITAVVAGAEPAIGGDKGSKGCARAQGTVHVFAEFSRFKITITAFEMLIPCELLKHVSTMTGWIELEKDGESWRVVAQSRELPDYGVNSLLKCANLFMPSLTQIERGEGGFDCWRWRLGRNSEGLIETESVTANAYGRKTGFYVISSEKMRTKTIWRKTSDGSRHLVFYHADENSPYCQSIIENFLEDELDLASCFDSVLKDASKFFFAECVLRESE